MGKKGEARAEHEFLLLEFVNHLLCIPEPFEYASKLQKDGQRNINWGFLWKKMHKAEEIQDPCIPRLVIYLWPCHPKCVSSSQEDRIPMEAVE